MTCAPPNVPRERAFSSVWALYYKMSGIDPSRGATATVRSLVTMLGFAPLRPNRDGGRWSLVVSCRCKGCGVLRMCMTGTSG